MDSYMLWYNFWFSTIMLTLPSVLQMKWYFSGLAFVWLSSNHRKSLSDAFCKLINFLYCYPQHKVCYRLHSLQKSISVIMKSKSHRKMLNNKGPIMDPWGIPNKISHQELKSKFIVCLCFRYGRKFCTNLKASILNPYAFSLAIKWSCKRQSNAFDRSVRSRLFQERCAIERARVHTRTKLFRSVINRTSKSHFWLHVFTT